MEKIDLYLETGQKRIFACAVDWPGWCRSGKNEAAVLQSLIDYGPRYALAVQSAGLDFQLPASLDDFRIIERLAGDSTTDFGAPSAIPAVDSRPVDQAELLRLKAILQAIWQNFDTTVAAAQGKTLRKGPRGGGRELEKIIEHVLGGESGYLNALGWSFKQHSDTPKESVTALRQVVLQGMDAAARGEIPDRGPRGGQRWPLRFFVRRSAWHILDHVWEIEDRAEGEA